MSRYALLLSLSAVFLTACGADVDVTEPAETSLAHTELVVDTHIDVPYRLELGPDDVTQATEGGDFDYPRARDGGLNVAFMSIYTPAELEPAGESFEVAESLIDLVENIVADGPDKFAIALSPEDVYNHANAGLISLPLGMENGSPIDGQIERLKYFYDRGIRYITLAHGKSNHISDSSYDENRQWGGLSEFGAEVVAEMNRLGIMIDISHVSDEAFWDVMELTAVPVIASHSSARHFTPGFERNMGDDMIKALADNGGVIMINFGSGFLTEAANQYSMSQWAAETAWLAERPDMDEEVAIAEFEKQWKEEHGPYPFADLDDVLDHIDHVVKLTSIDHVGIGSDYDGVGDSLPTGLKDVSTYPNLVDGLRGRGYSDADIKKILGSNLMRVWQKVHDYAATTSSST